MIVRCKKCKAGVTTAATAEKLEGRVDGYLAVSDAGDVAEFEPGGYTEIAWDSSVTTAYICECGDFETPTLAELVEVADEDDED
jgi:hypothetical protein